MKLLTAFALLALTCFAHAGTSIQNHEQVENQARCVIDPNNASRMNCEQYCQFVNKHSQQPLGSENKGWNCDSRAKKLGWQMSWNQSHPDKQLKGDCTQGSPTATGFHKGECEFNTETLQMPPVIHLNHIASWANYDPACSSNTTIPNCPRFHVGIRMADNAIYTVNKYGVFYSEHSKWVTGPVGTLPSTLASNYNITVSPIQNMHLLTTNSTSSRQWEYRDSSPDRPMSGNQTIEIHFDIRACEKANPSNCQSTRVNMTLGFDSH